MAGSMNKYIAELLGTFVLVGFGSMAILAGGGPGTPGGLLVIAIGFGLALMAGIYMFGGLSGAHFNPAVTVAMVLRKDTSSSDAIGYIIAQVAGAVLASGLVAYASSTAAVQVTATVPGGGLDTVQVVILEAILTAVFVMVILRTTSDGGSGAAVAIPMTLIAIHLAAVPLTGASVNPARSLGPAIIGGAYGDIWVYIVGPLLGGVVGYYVDKFVNESQTTKS